MNITLVYSRAPREVREWHLTLTSGTTIAQAIAAANVAQEFPELQSAAGLFAGIWGKKTELDAPLQAGDRVELYRPLRVDPKVARRERFDGQGVKRAGLFAKTRAGAKAGY